MTKLQVVPAPTRKDRTRLALISAGEALMATQSVDAVSIDEIVELAGVAKGTFYNHFPDKEALQHDILVAIRTDIRNEIANINRNIDDPARRLARAFSTVLQYATQNPVRGNFLIRTSMAFRLVDDRMNEGLVREISFGLAQGRFQISTTESGALLMLGIVQAAMVQALVQSDLFPLVSRTQQMGAMLLRGLGLSNAEAEQMAAQEADHIICQHDFARKS